MRETKFWKDMIEQYLKPLYEDKDAKKKVKEGLKELKNKYSLMFMLVNSMWIAAIFMLQNSQDALNIPWRLGPMVNNITFESTMTPGQDSNNVFVNKEYSKLEPLGFFFVITFIFIMIIQFVGMLLHRLMTLGHIVASTKLGFFGAKRKLNPDEFLNKHGVEVIKEIQDTVEPPKEGVTMEEAVEQELKNITEGGDDVRRRLSRSATIKNLHRSDTISALKRKQSKYGERKATVRRRTLRKKEDEGLSNEPIREDEEDSQPSPSNVPFAVRRTMSKIDPEGLKDRDV